MRFIPRSLYMRISAALTLIVLCFALLQIGLIIMRVDRANQETKQRVHWNVAEHLAPQVLKFTSPVFRRDEIRRLFSDLRSTNPGIDLFILNSIGRVVHPIYREGSQIVEPFVKTEPIEKFLRLSFDRELPIFGTNPYDPDEPVTFSAARIKIEGRKAYLYITLRSRQFDQTEGGIVDYYLLSGAVITTFILTLAAAAFGVLIMALITKRFRSLSSTVIQFASGDRDARISEGGSDEISQLATAFNQMADTINEHIEHLERRDKVRRDLVAEVSHDLGKPLSSMRGYLENFLAAEERMSDKEKSEKVAVALQSTKLLSRLIDELFELSSLEASEKQPNIEAFSLVELIALDLLPELTEQASSKEILITTDLPDDLPMVYADFVMIMRVITNLVENAIRYNPPKTTVTIELRQIDDLVATKVRDNGIGIADEDIPFIFDRFYRKKHGKQFLSAGTGLGLAIVKKIIEAHGQEIQIKSKESFGTEFCFFLTTKAPGSDNEKSTVD